MSLEGVIAVWFAVSLLAMLIENVQLFFHLINLGLSPSFSRMSTPGYLVSMFSDYATNNNVIIRKRLFVRRVIWGSGILSTILSFVFVW